MSIRLYQLGGFRPQIQWHTLYDDKPLVEAVAGVQSPLRRNSSAPLLLVLGIKSSGSSHLLLTEEQTRLLVKHSQVRVHQNSYFVPSDFEALSPIYFRTAEDLIKKLSVLKPKAVKKGKIREGAPQDTSQANRIYSDSQPQLERGEFERGRTFYHALSGSSDVRQFNVPDTTWKKSIRVCAFVFNTKGLDTRPWGERVEQPSILDFGWAEATLPAFSPMVDGVYHIKHSRNKFINIPGKIIEEFEYGDTEYLESDDIKSRLEDLLKGHLSAIANEPLILLVHDEKITRNALNNLGFNLSTWKSGIKDLLNGEKSQEIIEQYKIQYGSRYSRDPRRASPPKLEYDDYDARNFRARSRSHSPNGNAYHSSRKLSPPRERTYPSGYIVDIKAMCTVLMQADHSAHNVRQITTFLGLGDPPAPGTKEPWCAGNEAVLAIDIWRSLICGPAIDEQRALRTAVSKNLHAFSQQFGVDPGPSNPGDDDDDDEDPNTFESLGESSAVQTSTTNHRAPYDPDSESDYGSD